MDNAFIKYNFQVLKAVASARGMGLTEHPEDLGATPRGTPASFWQLEECDELEQLGYSSWAIHQSDFATPYAKPSRFMDNSNVGNHQYSGWPLFDADDRYLGLLPHRGRMPYSLERQAGDDCFRIGPTAFYPAELNKFLADIVCKDYLTRNKLPPVPSEGETRPMEAALAFPTLAGGPNPGDKEKATTPDFVMKTNDWKDAGPPPLGAGWTGNGRPSMVGRGNKCRPIRDGGGLCSPGRWQKSERKLPDTSHLRETLVKILSDGFDLHGSRGPEALRDLVIRLACGKVNTTPCSNHIIEKAQEAIRDWCVKWGHCLKSCPEDRPQAINTRLLQAFLATCQDPDAAALDAYSVGVRLGAGMIMPKNTSGVFRENEVEAGGARRLGGQLDRSLEG